MLPEPPPSRPRAAASRRGGGWAAVLALMVWMALLGSGLGTATGAWSAAVAYRADAHALPHHRTGGPAQAGRSARLERAPDVAAPAAAGGVDGPTLPGFEPVACAAAQPWPRHACAAVRPLRHAAAPDPQGAPRWQRPAPRAPPTLA